MSDIQKLKRITDKQQINMKQNNEKATKFF